MNQQFTYKVVLFNDKCLFRISNMRVQVMQTNDKFPILDIMVLMVNNIK